MEKGIAYSEYLRRFEPEDRAILAAVLMEKADHCPSCGLTDAEYLEDPDAYVAMQVTCPWCALRDRVRTDSDTDSSIPGATVKLVSKGTARRMISMPAKRPKSRREKKREREQGL